MDISGLSEDLQSKLEFLITFFKNKRVIVAFSGGVDSSLLAYLSKTYAEKTLLLTASSPFFSQKELQDAKTFSRRFKIGGDIVPHSVLLIGI